MKYFFPCVILLSCYQSSHVAAAAQSPSPTQSFVDISDKDRTTVLRQIEAVQRRFDQGIAIRRANRLPIPSRAAKIRLDYPDLSVKQPLRLRPMHTSFAHDVGLAENIKAFRDINEILSRYNLPAEELRTSFFDKRNIPIQDWTYKNLEKLKSLMSCTTLLQEQLCRFRPDLQRIYPLCNSKSINNVDRNGRTALYLATINLRYTDLSIFVHLLAKGADLHAASPEDPNDTPFKRIQKLDDQFTIEQRLAEYHNWTPARRKIAALWKLFLHTERKHRGKKSYWHYELKNDYPWMQSEVSKRQVGQKTLF